MKRLQPPDKIQVKANGQEPTVVGSALFLRVLLLASSIYWKFEAPLQLSGYATNQESVRPRMHRPTKPVSDVIQPGSRGRSPKEVFDLSLRSSTLHYRAATSLTSYPQVSDVARFDRWQSSFVCRPASTNGGFSLHTSGNRRKEVVQGPIRRLRKREAPQTTR
jgi:hypothetical protein